MKQIDWNLLRAFHMTASTGSLSAAARKLDLTQPTLSRQVASLEANLGVTLFERLGKRLSLTQTGRELLEHIGTMGEAAEAVVLSASGRVQDVSGQLCISATDTFSTYVLPEIVEKIRTEAPHITIKLDVANTHSNLHQMEADIAIRHVRPEQKDLVGEYVRDTEACFYASERWVAEHGLPSTPSELDGKHLIGFDDTLRLASYLSELGFQVDASDFRLISDSAVVAWEMVKRGMGVAAMLREVAQTTPELVRLFPGLKPVPVPIWLVTHQAMQNSPRVRLALKILARELSRK
jgi:DNA-binding transcriptional LysR family regulator